MTALPRPPRSPDPRAPNDFERWTRELKDYLDRAYAAIVAAAGDAADKQPLSATLTGIDNLSGSTGLIEQSAPNVFSVRGVGTASASHVLRRSDGDTRYSLAGAADNKVTGPSSATDNAVMRFDGTTGKVAQNSPVTIDDNGVLAGFRFGTHTGSADAAVSGYIEITDAGGTTRKLAVIT